MLEPVVGDDPRLEPTITAVQMKTSPPTTRACTPSPPTSPKLSRNTVFREIQNTVQSHSNSGKPKTILKKRSARFSVYKCRAKLVDNERDEAVASNYEMLLFSNMVVEIGRVPCIRCRMCPKSPSSSFYCHTIQDFEALGPYVEHHLMEVCPHAPEWLAREVHRTKRTHYAEIDPSVPFSHVVWGRIAKACGQRRKGAQTERRVKFSHKLCEEFIIAPRSNKRKQQSILRKSSRKRIKLAARMQRVSRPPLAALTW